MTHITLQLSDELVLKAKQAGIYNEKQFADFIHEYLERELTHYSLDNKKPKSPFYDFIKSLPKANYEKDGLEIQKELRF